MKVASVTFEFGIVEYLLLHIRIVGDDFSLVYILNAAFIFFHLVYNMVEF